MMGTEIFKIDASWAEKLTKTRVSFLTAPTVNDLDDLDDLDDRPLPKPALRTRDIPAPRM